MFPTKQQPPGAHYGYGSAVPQHAAPKRRRINALAVLTSLLLPCGIFAAVFWLLSFSFHFRSAQTCWLLVMAAGLLVAASAIFAIRAFGSLRAGFGGLGETVHVFVFVTTALAWGLGVALGYSNYTANMNRYYMITGLSTYSAVDPAKTSGARLLDAGRVIFTRNSVLDVRHSSGFKSGQTYCVVPITSSQEPLASYDFWAVGVDCCSSDKPSFHCGEFENPRAHAGLRLLTETEQPFFRLAVQQAEASHHIKANHPLFFEWTEDPLAEVSRLKESGWQFFYRGLLGFGVAQLILTVLLFLWSVCSVHKRADGADRLAQA